MRRQRVLAEARYWLLRYRRTWRGTVVISIANPALFLTALGAGLGPLVDRHQSAYLHGVPYLAFLAPGLLAAAMMQTAYVESAGPVSISARRGGTYRAALATPLEPAELYLGHLLFVAFRLATSALAFALVAWSFDALPGAQLPAVVGAALLTGLAFAAPVAAWAVSVERTALLTGLFRFVVMPLYMFSGTFFAPEQLPAWLRTIVAATPLYHGVQLCRSLALGTATAAGTVEHVGYLLAVTAIGLAAGCRSYPRARGMSAGSGAAVARPTPGLLGGVRFMVERNLIVYRHTWFLLVAEVLEPLLYLASIGLGIGALVGRVPGLGGTSVRYPEFVAPALLATAAMNAAMNETAFLMYTRLTIERTYEPILATPMSVREIGLGEAAWAVLRGVIVTSAFLTLVAAFGLIASPWAVLVVPGAGLIAVAFAAAGLVVVTYLRGWADFQYVQLVMLPMFLFATTFYPLAVYPRSLQILVECLPLYQAIELLRQPALGHVGPGLLVPVLYLAAMGTVALAWALRRLRALLEH